MILLWAQGGALVPPPDNVRGQTYEKYVSSLAPVHWYTLDESSGSVAYDIGSLASDGAYTGTDSRSYSAVRYVGTAKRCREVDGVSGDSMRAPSFGFGVNPAGRTSGYSVGFWIAAKTPVNSSDANILTIENSNAGFGFSVHCNDGRVYFRKFEQNGVVHEIEVAADYYPTYSSLESLDYGDFAFYVFTVDEGGVLRAYVDGREVSAPVSTMSEGIRAPFDLQTALLVGGGYRDRNGLLPCALDELVFFERALTRQEITNINMLAVYGNSSSAGYPSLLGLSGLSGYALTDLEFSELSDGQDITGYVTAFEVRSGLKEMLSEGTMTIKESVQGAALNVSPNDMIVVQERYTSHDGAYDSGWLDVGSWLTSGPPIKGQSSTGELASQIGLKSAAKLMTLSPFVGKLQPDVIVLNKVPMTRVRLSPSDAYEFQIPIPNSSGRYYDHWQASPTPTLYVSKFRNKRKEVGDDDEFSDSEMPSRMVVKNEGNSMQILPGKGMIRIDRDFYERPITNGLGNPDPDGGVLISLQRFCSYSDLVQVTVRSLYTRGGRWMVELDGMTPIYQSIGDVESAGMDDAVFSDSASIGDWGHSSSHENDPSSSIASYYFRCLDADQTVSYTSPAETDRVGFYAPKTPDGGIVAVSVNGDDDGAVLFPTVAELKALDAVAYGHLTLDDNLRVVDLYAEEQASDILFLAADGLPPKNMGHSLTLRVTGEKHAFSSAAYGQIAAFARGAGDPKALPRPVGQTLIMRSGDATAKRFKLLPESSIRSGGDGVVSASFSNAAEMSSVESGIEWTGGDSYDGATFHPGFACNGAPVFAARSDNLPAYSKLMQEGERTTALHVAAANVDAGASDAPVQNITIKISRTSYCQAGVPNAASMGMPNTDSPFADWGYSVRPYRVSLTLDGEVLTPNKKDGGNSGAQGLFLPSFEHVSYSYTPEQWGLPSGFPVKDLDRLGVVIVAEALKNNVVVFVENVSMQATVSGAAPTTSAFVVFDELGNICNPVRNGLAVGDSAQLGDCGAIEDALALLGRQNDLQVVDSSKPFYFNIDKAPTTLQSVIVPQVYSRSQRALPLQVASDVMQSAPGNYNLLAQEDGSLKVKNIVQQREGTAVLATDSAMAASDEAVYTRVVQVGDGGESVNLTSSESCAIRAAKLDNWATTESTPSGTGSASNHGKAYAGTDTDYAEMNGRLLGLLDLSNRTPILEGNGWDEIDSLGVLWATRDKGSTLAAMEDQPLFIIDVGRSVEGLEYRIAEIQTAHADTYKWGPGITQAVQFFYMTEADYTAVFGGPPPAEPSQDAANKAFSYFPPGESDMWRPLTDRVNMPHGLTTVSSDKFVDSEPVKARFIMCKCLQANYFDGDGEDEEERSRISITEVKVFSSTEIVASATLGVSELFGSRNYQDIVSRLRHRTYIPDPSPVVNTAETGYSAALVTLNELYQDFKAFPVETPQRVAPGDTIWYLDLRQDRRRGLVESVSVDIMTGVRVATIINTLPSPDEEMYAAT